MADRVKTIIACALLLWMTPLVTHAAEDYEARIKKLEEDVKTLRAEQAEQAEKSANDMRVFWKEGLRFETPDKDFTLKVGGRVMADGVWVSEDDGIKSNVGDQQDGVEFRRTRLGVEGLMYGNVEYKMEFDFAGGDADFTDVYIAFPDFSLGRLKIGHFKEPYGLEELTSSKYITFIERVGSSVDPARNMGAMLSNSFHDERMTWAAGVFKITDSFGALQDDGGYAGTGRITGLPVYEDDGASLLHPLFVEHLRLDLPWRQRDRVVGGFPQLVERVAELVHHLHVRAHLAAGEQLGHVAQLQLVEPQVPLELRASLLELRVDPRSRLLLLRVHAVIDDDRVEQKDEEKQDAGLELEHRQSPSALHAGTPPRKVRSAPRRRSVPS